ncbi:pupal cuticle protein Edg-84A-like [Anopheles ziemanni]|uniref:pupal cuticle protein Edg-84A-like n=1 Tax=Anopheles coustani TaxID=139045 RepID=UPI00265AB6BE|nr:pupal cuticle protein Edg-84A-like [Anopheles coustani]XP_058166574.1 pupal cuticle protein Edg-84A-like [Anopheles ziemanni]
MAFKFVLLATLVAAASAGLLPAAHHGIATSHSTIQHHAAPAVHHVGAIHAAPAVYHHQPTIVKTIVQPTILKSYGHHDDHYEHHAPANYEFSYSVHDEHTGDIKSQHETRHGDEVHGQYSLLDSDGHHRVVDYHADHHSGFNAVVRREPTGVKIAQPVHKVIAQPIHVSSYAHAPVAHATIQHHHAAPIAHHVAPIAHHVAPIAHHVAPIAHHVAPIAHHAAPIAHSSSSIVHGASHLSHHHY